MDHIAGESMGQTIAMRFDVALVDRRGRIEVIEHVFWN